MYLSCFVILSVTAAEHC